MNPPAFPTLQAIAASGAVRSTSGMTMRDWFAGQALAGMLCNGFMPKNLAELPEYQALSEVDWDYPKKAYELADAMLKEGGYDSP